MKKYFNNNNIELIINLITVERMCIPKAGKLKSPNLSKDCYKEVWLGREADRPSSNKTVIYGILFIELRTEDFWTVYRHTGIFHENKIKEYFEIH